ncbi:MAG: hypothetical protein ABFS45_17330 [Pseudomonadota bacterium]
MPFIHIKSLPFKQDFDAALATKTISQAFSEQMKIPAEHISVTWEYYYPGHYAHNNEISDIQPVASHPLFIELLAPDFHSETTVGKMLKSIAANVSKSTGISSNNIFIHYQQAHSGMVFDDGAIIHW